MTTNQAIDKFSVLVDQHGSPNFSATEALQFLNQAQLEVLNRVFPDTLGGTVNFEVDSNVLTNIQPLVYPLSLIVSSSSRVTISTIETALATASTDPSPKIHSIMNVGILDDNVFIPVKFLKHNNRFSYQTNTFKQPSVDSRRIYYIIEADDIKFIPDLNGNSVTITVLKLPKLLTADNSPEWNDYMMNQVIFKALDIAAISTRDQEMTSSLRNSNVQSAQ